MGALVASLPRGARDLVPTSLSLERRRRLASAEAAGILERRDAARERVSDGWHKVTLPAIRQFALTGELPEPTPRPARPVIEE